MVRPAALIPLVVVALITTMLAAAAAGRSGLNANRQPRPAATERPVARVPQEDLAPVSTLPRPAAPAERRPPSRPRGYPVLQVHAGRSVKLRGAPGGRTVARVAARTEFGSPAVLSVARTRGNWLGVVSAALPNGKLGWVKKGDAAVRPAAVARVSISVDLSERSLELRKGRRLLRRVRVAVGRPGSSTPTGRFAVTDKLAGSRYGPYYGCCILALSGKQPNPPPGWRGGNRIAIHGTNAPGSLGQASSAGCVRASDADLRVLMRRVPMGTPVFVHG
jgi:lipoprotein-anchoring transpeptidase ErfK/SrfK